MRCYIFDLDGTLCDIEHRLHYIVPPTHTHAPQWSGAGVAVDLANDRIATESFKRDWDSFFAACVGDKPIAAICALATDLSRQAPLVFVSGRSDAVRAQTVEWLRLHLTAVRDRNFKLYMRRDGDHRPDHVAKAEMLDQLLADGYVPIMAFDDRKQVVDMWRERGVVCAQVAPGDF